MKTNNLLAAIFIAAFALPSFAQTATPEIAHTERNQENRIVRGVRSGELTPTEASRLQRQQNVIRADKRAAKVDGVVTAAERRKIKREQKRANRAIYNKKHNAATS